MIRYLLDTDTFSYYAKRKSSLLQDRIDQMAAGIWALSAISHGEVLFGLESLPLFHPLRSRTLDTLNATQILDWPSAAAVPYALIRHNTRKQPIGDRDYMIAAHAIAMDATLVTNNTRHFSRIGLPLRLENWLD